MATLLKAMRTRLPQPEKTGFAIATHFTVCAFLCGLAIFGFYKLMQPERNANPGIAAYTPPPRTVVNYPAAQFKHNQTAASSPAIDVPPADKADETTGRAIQAEETAPRKVDPSPAIGPTLAPAEKPVAKRALAARPHSTATRERAWVGNYSSARIGPYPGYAAVH